MFDDFLVAIAICYQDSFISDAKILFFECCNREQKESISGKNVQHTIKIISKLNNISNTEDWITHDEIVQFCKNVFGNDSDNTYLEMSQFNKRVKDESAFIQKFLQFVILTNLDVDINPEEDGINVRLRKSVNDFVHDEQDDNHVSVNMSDVGNTNISRKRSVPTVSSTN